MLTVVVTMNLQDIGCGIVIHFDATSSSKTFNCSTISETIVYNMSSDVLQMIQIIPPNVIVQSSEGFIDILLILTGMTLCMTFYTDIYKISGMPLIWCLNGCSVGSSNL